MKAAIHPTYQIASVVCSCGNTFETSSTRDSIRVEVCHKCHPLYTGEHRFIDTKGRVEKFQKKQQDAVKIREQFVAKKAQKKASGQYQPKSLRELLGEI